MDISTGQLICYFKLQLSQPSLIKGDESALFLSILNNSFKITKNGIKQKNVAKFAESGLYLFIVLKPKWRHFYISAYFCLQYFLPCKLSFFVFSLTDL